MAVPICAPNRYQTRIDRSVQIAKDEKNSFGLGKKDWNTEWSAFSAWDKRAFKKPLFGAKLGQKKVASNAINRL
ncbi:hypothetical protein GCM10007920_08770 [Ciceribacter naphthalenivorans]|uniref:Uncharacterized protein n=2 Tax=Alphaproteobacteria TaxID=28211 RepID=A0A512HF10_9HYPH|nr:hypothetical protein RNA01_09630 [Ciceribacter naphthalenivorans]GLR21091.1 hypothetical protein GCM10007920_08770 [Ciceribacter naphthalenivorans]GLT03947.1 hypothetical protein GCM10007926_08770 [Sphingomonas psychrolutea]